MRFPQAKVFLRKSVPFPCESAASVRGIGNCNIYGPNPSFTVLSVYCVGSWIDNTIHAQILQYVLSYTIHWYSDMFRSPKHHLHEVLRKTINYNHRQNIKYIKIWFDKNVTEILMYLVIHLCFKYGPRQLNRYCDYARGWKVRGSNSRGGRDFQHPSRPALGHTQPPIQWVPGLSRG